MADIVLSFDGSDEEVQNLILALLVTRFTEDKHFLKKVNKTTFGLISGDRNL